jgi:hypothetical protein
MSLYTKVIQNQVLIVNKAVYWVDTELLGVLQVKYVTCRNAKQNCLEILYS